eukprot:gene23276-31603_t
MFQRIRIDKKVTNSILTAFIISCSSYPQGSPAYAADSADEINFTTTESVPQLTAAQLLKTDIDPKVDVLKDILFVFKLYPTYAEKKDYVSIRQSLREEPAMNLRKTCKKLGKYLPSNVQDKFSAAYSDMIDSLNEMDVLALQRMQGSGVPADNVEDVKFSKSVSDTIGKYEKMLDTLSAI